MTAVKNVGEGAIQSLLEVRNTRGRILSLSALCEDLDLRFVNKRVFESLIKAGAFDGMGGAPAAGAPVRLLRAQLMASLDAACEHGARHQRDRLEGQAQLFGSEGAHESQAAPLPDVPPWSEAEQLAFEKETLGLYWSGHPVDRYTVELRALGARTTTELGDLPVTGPRQTAGPPGSRSIEPETSIGGIVAACRLLKTRKGDRMAVFTLDDAVGSVEVVVFPETYQRSAEVIETGRLVLVRGKVERDEETVRLLAAEVAPLDSVRERATREIAIRVSAGGRDTFEALGEILSRHRGDRRVSFEIDVPADPRPIRVRADLSTQIRVRPSSKLVAELEQVVGQGAVMLR